VRDPRGKRAGLMHDPAGANPTDELNVLFVVYELAGEEEAEPAASLVEALREHPACAQLTSSAWLVKTPRSAADVFETLDRTLGPDDRLFVGGASGDAAWRNIEHGYDWLEETLGSFEAP
jgi:hypothetical protein